MKKLSTKRSFCFMQHGSFLAGCLLFMFFALGLLPCLGTAPAWAALPGPGGGNGTETSPYVITTAEELAWLAGITNYEASQAPTNEAWRNMHYKLGNDIDLGGYSNWEPIGAFGGVFDGNYKTISNLTINKFAFDVGLFGSVGRFFVMLPTPGYTPATVKNLYLSNVNIIGGYGVGGVAGLNSFGGTVDNCHVTGSVTAISREAGGVAGCNYGTLRNCRFTGSVKSNLTVAGGVAGYNVNAGNVQNCQATGSVRAIIREAGGVVGYNERGMVDNSHFTGSVTSKTRAGGVVGYNNDAVINCYAAGSVTANSEAGGVVGKMGKMDYSQGEVLSCHAASSVKANERAGGVVGDNEDCTVLLCYATGNVTAGNEAGGVVGRSSGMVQLCYATGRVEADERAGGVVGYIYNNGTVLTCYATGDVIADNDVGGVAGHNESGTVRYCYATCYIEAVNGVGGVAGRNENGGTVQGCVALNESVKGATNVGRVAGINTQCH